MTEGQLKKRMFTHLKTFCVHAPEVDDKGEVIDQYLHPSSRQTTDEEKKAIIDEAKKDIYYHLSFDDYKDVKVPYDEIQDLLDKIVKWFGDST